LTKDSMPDIIKVASPSPKAPLSKFPPSLPGQGSHLLDQILYLLPQTLELESHGKAMNVLQSVEIGPGVVEL
jgi:hypothetical protein